MTWAAEQPRGARWRRSAATRQATSTAATETRTVVRPLGASMVGFLAILAAAWGAIAVFWGPDFGYYPTSLRAWDWTTQNWLLHVIPGAVGVFAGLMILGLSPARRAGTAATMALPALLLIAAGVWFVIGPALWATFESGTPFITGTTAGRSFANQVGSSLGPGLLLAIFGGMALKASVARPAVDTVPATAERTIVQEPVAAAAATPVAEPAAAPAVERRTVTAPEAAAE